MDGYYRTIHTLDNPPDEQVNELIDQGWRVVSAAIFPLNDDQWNYLRVNFFTVLVYDKDDAEEAADERFNAN